MKTRRIFLKGALLMTGAFVTDAAHAATSSLRTNTKQSKTQTQPSVKPQPTAGSPQNPTVTKLKEELAKTARDACVTPDLANLNPILIGRHIVFSKKWMDHINENGLTPQEFSQWRNNADRVFDAYVGFIGQTPNNGTKVFVDIAPANNFKKKDGTYFGAYAYGETNLICYNEINVQNGFWEIKKGGCDSLIIHELGHTFAAKMKWEAEAEAVTNMMMSYVLETTDIRYGTTSGKQHRQEKFAEAQAKLKGSARKGTSIGLKGSYMTPFAYEDGTAYDYYLLGLVDKVGWETYKKAIRSYNNDSYIPKKYKDYEKTTPYDDYTGADKKVKARDFLDRIEFFSGKPGVLESLPDKGAILKKHFNPQIDRNKTRLNS